MIAATTLLDAAESAARALAAAGIESGLVGLALLMVAALRRWPAPLRSGIMGVALLAFATILLPDSWRRSLPAGAPFPAGFSLDDAVPSPWLLAALGVWGVGSAFQLARLLVARRRLGREVASAAERPAGPLALEVRRAAAALSIRPPRVVVAAGAHAPFLAGPLRPTLVVPERWSEVAGPAEIRLALVHELAHLARRDLAWIELAAWLSVCWWWHPVFWLVVSRLRSAQEDACDDLALIVERSERRRYCEVLLRWATGEHRGSAAFQPASLGMHGVERRVRRLLDPATRHHRRLSAVQVVGLAVLAALLLPGFRPAPPDEGHAAAHRARHLHLHPLSH
jgi:Zn-dependent protease with chaperone function